MQIRIPILDCTADSDQRAGIFLESNLHQYPHWFGRRAADHQPILFLIGPPSPAETLDSPGSPSDPAERVACRISPRSPCEPASPVAWRMFYLFERAHVRDLRRISHPLERYDEIIYFDRASLVRRITLADALIWFHDHRRALPPLMRAVIAASAQFPENNPGTLLALPPPTPPPLALPAPAQSTITFQPALLSDRRPGRPRLQTYKSLRRTKLVTAWRLAKSQHISRSDFCAHRGIEIADLARAINWATKRRSRDNKHFLDRLHV